MGVGIPRSWSEVILSEDDFSACTICLTHPLIILPYILEHTLLSFIGSTFIVGNMSQGHVGLVYPLQAC